MPAAVIKQADGKGQAGETGFNLRDDPGQRPVKVIMFARNPGTAALEFKHDLGLFSFSNLLGDGQDPFFTRGFDKKAGGHDINGLAVFFMKTKFPAVYLAVPQDQFRDLVSECLRIKADFGGGLADDFRSVPARGLAKARVGVDDLVIIQRGQPDHIGTQADDFIDIFTRDAGHLPVAAGLPLIFEPAQFIGRPRDKHLEQRFAGVDIPGRGGVDDLDQPAGLAISINQRQAHIAFRLEPPEQRGFWPGLARGAGYGTGARLKRRLSRRAGQIKFHAARDLAPATGGQRAQAFAGPGYFTDQHAVGLEQLLDAEGIFSEKIIALADIEGLGQIIKHPALLPAFERQRYRF